MADPMMRLISRFALLCLLAPTLALAAPPKPVYVTGSPSSGNITKFSGAQTVTAATSGTDYAPATTGAAILYGNGSGGFSNVSIGSGVNFTGGTLSASGSGGSVTSVGLSLPGMFTVSGSPVTGSGSLTAVLATQSANAVFGGPSTGSAAAPTFRSLVGADLPNPAASTLGGVESLAAVTHDFLTSISTSGVPTQARPACADLSDSVASCSTDATNASNISSGTLAAARLAANTKVRGFGTSFGDTGGSALTSGSVVYLTVPYSCTISAFNITVDAGTVTFDVWKIATGSAVPTVTNAITASALPALSTGTAVHSTTLTSWTTSVSANDIIGIQLKTVATAKYAEIDLECDQ
jgi:hypothetical protein